MLARSFRFFWLSLLLLFLLNCTSTQSNCQGCEVRSRPLDPRVIFTKPDGKKITVRVELACNYEQRRRGLMHRKNMADDRGMLFLFPTSEIHSFWMKNTFIPLDMIHIDRNKVIVGIVEDAKPHDESGHGVGKKALYVLEVNAFFAKMHNIKAGDVVQFLDISNCAT